MNIILLGAPGAGKGSVAVKFIEYYKIPQISTGDIFRANIKNQTELGKLAKSFIDKGQLVPDEVTIAIVKDRLAQADCSNGYLLDGFPRTLAQAEALSTFANIDYVFNMEVDFGLLMARLTGRRVCPKCGATFHINSLQGRTTCDKCGSEVVHRPDDKEDVIGNRLEVYKMQSKPLIAYYEKIGNLYNVNASQQTAGLFEDVKKIIAGK